MTKLVCTAQISNSYNQTSKKFTNATPLQDSLPVPATSTNLLHIRNPSCWQTTSSMLSLDTAGARSLFVMTKNGCRIRLSVFVLHIWPSILSAATWLITRMALQRALAKKSKLCSSKTNPAAPKTQLPKHYTNDHKTPPFKEAICRWNMCKNAIILRQNCSNSWSQLKNRRLMKPGNVTKWPNSNMKIMRLVSIKKFKRETLLNIKNSLVRQS